MKTEARDLEAAILHHIEMENRRDLEGTMATVAEGGADYVTVATGERIRSNAEVREFYRGFFEAVPDLHIEVRRLCVDVARRTVAAEVLTAGTLAKAHWGLAPTHRRFELAVSVVYELDADGRITAERSYFDKDELLESMGLIVSTKTALGRLLLLLPQSPLYAIRCAILAIAGKA